MATQAVQVLSDHLDELVQTRVNYEQRQEELRLTIMNLNDDIASVQTALKLLSSHEDCCEGGC